MLSGTDDCNNQTHTLNILFNKFQHIYDNEAKKTSIPAKKKKKIAQLYI